MFNGYKTKELKKAFDIIVADFDNTYESIIEFNMGIVGKLSTDKIIKKDLSYVIDTKNKIGISIEEWLMVSYALITMDININFSIINKSIRYLINCYKSDKGKYKYIFDTFFEINEMQLGCLTMGNIDDFMKHVSGNYWKTIYHYIQAKPI